MASKVEELEKIILQQGRQIILLSKRIAALEGGEKTEVQPQTVEEKPHPKQHPKEVSAPINFFKVFGIVGVLLIILGAVYFYKYAVDNGWIGITGRVALGVISSLIFITVGLFVYRKKYINYSQFIISAGLGILYFTIFATYHFREYRESLEMTLFFNTILLLVVMAGGMFIGIRLDTRFVVYGSLFLGYIAAFLSGIDGDTLHILIYILIIDFIVLLIAKFKSWNIAIPAQVFTYIAYSIWYVQGITNRQSILSQTTMPLFMTLGFLFAYYVLFTLISFLQSSEHKETEGLVISIINTVALAGFGLGIINTYASEFNGLYLMIIAALTIVVGSIAKFAGSKTLFNIHFLATCILVAIAVPVQFDNSIVTVLWVLMMLGLSFAGLKLRDRKLFFVGYIGYVIPVLRVFFYDLFFLDDSVERWFAVGAGIGGIIVLQFLLSRFRESTKSEDSGAYKIYSVAGLFLLVIWIAREIYDLDISRGTQHVFTSVAWALLAICIITYGVVQKKTVFNWSGIILFGIVVIKVLVLDLSRMQNILRVTALIVVGILALVGSFVFVKNKEKIKEFF